VKIFFDARIEPQILFLLNGTEVRRQVGFNFNLMDTHCEEIVDFHCNSANYVGDSGNQWERFYDSFDRFEMEGHADRDSFRMRLHT